MPINHLHDKSLDRFLGLPGWNDPVSNEPLPGPQVEGTNWSRQAEIDRIRASVRTILARGDELSVDELFALCRPVCIAVHFGRAAAEQPAGLREICDMLRGERTVARFEDEATWKEAIASTRRIRHLSGIDLY